MTAVVARRLDPERRSGLRLTLLVVGLVVVAFVVVPLAVLVRDQWAPLAELDARVTAAAYDAALEHAWLADLAKVLTWLGAPLVLQIVTGVIVVLLLVRHRRRSALYLATCVAGAYTLSTLGKGVVDRLRPVLPDPISHARGPSFPSGHATGSAAFYLALAVVLLPWVPRARRWWLFAGAFVIPVVVAATRVILGVHYLSDVVAGLLLGWGWVIACTALFAAWRAEEGRPAPVLEEGVE